MDQTLVFFSMESKTTLDLDGLKTIRTQLSTSDTKQATVAATMAASGHQLPFTVIFKGGPGGSIERQEIPQYPVSSFMQCRKRHGWTKL